MCDQQGVFLECSIAGKNGFIGAGLYCGAAVIKPEKCQFSTVAVDDAQVADNACQQLWFAAFFQVGQRGLHETAHFVGAGIEQVAGEVETQCGFFLLQTFTEIPWCGLCQSGFLCAAAMSVIGQVEQSNLMGVGLLGQGIVESQIDACQQGGAIEMQTVECASLDQRLYRAFVEFAAIDACTKIKQAGKRTVFLTRGHNRGNCAFACTLDGAQAVADDAVADRLKAVLAAVDVGRFELHAHSNGILMQHLELVGVVEFHGHVGAEELGGKVCFQPGGLVGQQRIGCGMRFVEAVTGELLHQVENFARLTGADALLRGAGAEQVPVLRHFFGFFLAHGAAQQIGAAQRISPDDLGCQHDLFLVDHDAVGFAQNAFEEGVRISHVLAAVFACHEARDIFHRAGPVHRVERNQVFKARGQRLAQHALHAAAFKLEYGFGLAVLKQLVGGLVVKRHVVEREVFLSLVARPDEVAGQFHDGERGQTQKVELHQAGSFHVVLVELAHGRVAARLLVQRAKVGELARRDQHATGVHADVAGQAFELLRQFDQRAHFVVVGDAFGQQGLGGDGVFFLVLCRQVGGRILQGYGFTRLVGHQLADAVAKTVGQVEYAAHVANGSACCHSAEGDDLADRFPAVFLLDVFDHAVAVALAEVDVKVGHAHPIGIQKTFEQQAVGQRVQIGDFQRIGHQRPRTRTAPWAYGAAVILGPVDEIGHDKKVAREAHLDDGFNFKLQAFQVP